MISISQFGLIILLSAFLLLHICILIKIIPYNIVWAGRLKSDKEMYRFEIISLLINAFLLTVILVQANFLSIDLPQKAITYILWLMALLFLLNTLGNAISKNKLEQKLFAPLTMLLTIFSIVLALKN